MSKILLFTVKGGEGKSVISKNMAAATENAVLSFTDNTANMSFLFKNREAFKSNHPLLSDLPMIETTTKETNEDGEIIHIDIINDVIEGIKDQEEKTGEEIHAFFDTGGYHAEEVDQERYLEYPHHKLIINSDYIIIPVGLSQIELQALSTMADILERLSKKIGRVIVANVVASRIHNRVTKNSKRFQALVNEVNKYKCFHLLDTVITERKEYEVAMELGLGVVESRKTSGSVAAREIRKLVSELQLPLKKRPQGAL